MGRKNAHIILAWLALLLIGGCNRTAEDGPGGPAMVNLGISVSAGDVSLPASRAAGDANAANADEKMHTLRIIVVRPDGTVEHNRLVDLTAAAVTEYDERFEVVANEEKRIYLFANEGLTTIKNGNPDDVVERPLPNFNFDTEIKEGKKFPRENLENLLISLSEGSEELAGALPMSECHKVWVPLQDSKCELFITRAAVKFSFRITNQGSRDLNLTGLSIDKMAWKEYYLPKGAVYGKPDADGIREIISFDVPSTGGENNGYYTFEKTFDNGLSLPAGETKNLDPIYLFEGKYSDPAGSASGKNYSMGVSIREFGEAQPPKEYFPKLPQLPRNTHVVVNVTIRGESEVNWTVDVVPYEETILDPGFGLDKLGIINY